MDREADGKPLKTPGSIYDAGYVKGNGLAKKSGDATGLGWHPKMPIPETYSYFGHCSGRTMSKSETKQAPTLGNKWRRK